MDLSSYYVFEAIKSYIVHMQLCMYLEIILGIRIDHNFPPIKINFTVDHSSRAANIYYCITLPF